MIAEIAQIDIELGEKDANLDKALGMIKKSTADLILFPELFTTGFDSENLAGLAEPLDGPTIREISRTCKNKIIAGSLVEGDGMRLYNTFVLVDDTGVMGSYRKMHLFDREKDFFTPGVETPVFPTHFGGVALATCYDVRFPEMFRKYMEEGAEFVFLCANFPKQRIKHWETFVKARAIENQFYVLACNRVGRDKQNSYSGRSLAVDPKGDLLCVGDDREEVLRCVIDRKNVKEARREFPVLKDIRLR